MRSYNRPHYYLIIETEGGKLMNTSVVNMKKVNGVELVHDSHFVLQCAVCNKRVKLHIKSKSDIKLLSNISGDVILSAMDIVYNFRCPTCGTNMMHYRDTINRLNCIIEESMDDRLIVHTYEPPKYNGVKIINEMLIDDYEYPSFVVINEESESWTRMIELITSVITSSPYSDMFEIHTCDSNVKGACFIRLNEANFNKYFADLQVGMHRFIEISESYFFDGLDYLASQLEGIYDFNHKEEK